MKTPLLFFFLLFLLTGSPPAALAQKVGSTSMQFVKVMPSARATALGDAYSVWASGAEAVFWNPAGVAFVENQDVSLTYLKWIFDTQQGALSYAASLGSIGAMGVQFQYVDFGSIDEVLWVSPYKDDPDYPGLTGRTFHPYAYLIGLSYSSRITDKFSTGISAKYAHESLYNDQLVSAITTKGDTTSVKTWANGIMFDFGLNYNTGFHTIHIAAAMQNFGPDVHYASEANPIPVSLRVGIAADLVGNDALFLPSEDSRLGVAFDLFQPNDYAQQAHLGVEYVYADFISFRTGYKFGYDADGFTAGVGVQKTMSDLTLSVDYSFSSLHYSLGTVQRISLGVAF